MLYLTVTACENSTILSIILFVKSLMSLIFILVPIILIVMLSIDLGKIVLGDGDTKKPISGIIAKMISACALFFVPNLVGLLMTLLGSVGVDFTICLDYATVDNIAFYKEVETEKKRLEQELIKAEHEAAKGEMDALEKAREEARKKNEEIEKERRDRIESTFDRGPDIEGNAQVARDVVWDKSDVSRVSNLTINQLIAILESHGGKAPRYIPYAADLITAENKYGVNVFFLLGVSALESGWINEEHDMISKCNNLGGVCATTNRPSYGCFKNSNCEFAYYSTRGEFIDAHARLLGNSYLKPDGAWYEGTTAYDVVIHYCPGCTSWPVTAEAIGDQLYGQVSKVM